MLWAFGNYSRFIRPGMKRIQANFPSVKDIYVSAFINPANKELVCVLVNSGNGAKQISLQNVGGNKKRKMVLYKTDNSENLGKHEITGNEITLPAKTVITILLN